LEIKWHFNGLKKKHNCYILHKPENTHAHTRVHTHRHTILSYRDVPQG